MSSINRLYTKNNVTIKKTVNIDDSLYQKLKVFTNKNYDATISEMINVCVEDYINKNKPTFYEKPRFETVTYRSIKIRVENLNKLKKMYKETGISVTRLLNAAIKDFLEINDNKR